jgi:hypothetical protein
MEWTEERFGGGGGGILFFVFSLSPFNEKISPKNNSSASPAAQPPTPKLHRRPVTL